ncbi:hypothetical protein [Georgenia deserti]|uniref:Flagellar protein FlgN n=1 Tax=Georgenia deserti TaxID=2093781 RepID=A0ABW4L3T1_9MICO
MADIYIKLDELKEVKTQLVGIVDEFENATSNSEALEGDIGDPYGRNELRSEAREFEERWDDKRKELKESLDKVREHVEAVIDGVEEWDTETAIELEPDSGSSSGSANQAV